ncbi:MAG: hypothetical protein R3C68_09915 [Myxococcota bacterium]
MVEFFGLVGESSLFWVNPRFAEDRLANSECQLIVCGRKGGRPQKTSLEKLIPRDVSTLVVFCSSPATKELVAWLIVGAFVGEYVENYLLSFVSHHFLLRWSHRKSPPSKVKASGNTNPLRHKTASLARAKEKR